MGEWHGQPAQGRRNNGRALNVIAIVLAVAALVVGVIALTRAAPTAPPASPASSAYLGAALGSSTEHHGRSPRAVPTYQPVDGRR